MKRSKTFISLLTAVVMAVCMVPAGIAETEGTETATVFSIEREETAGWNTAGSAEEWDEQLEALRKEGLASPISEGDLREADPEAEVKRQDDRIFMISSKSALGNVKGVADACRTVYRLVGLLGGSGETELRPWSVLTVGSMKVYAFQHVFDGLTVVGSTVKLAADSDGRVIAVFSSLSAGNPEATGKEAVTAAGAEEIVREKLKEQGLEDTVDPKFTFKAVLPADFDVDAEGTPPDRLVWVVYTANPAVAEGKGSDLPYLAHYVDMNGTWLHSVSVSCPGDQTARTGYAVDHFFDGMESRILTGSFTDSEGKSVEYSVPVMKDPGTGLWYLGDPGRKIVLGEFRPMIYDDPRKLELVTSESMDAWNTEDIQAYQNIIRSWDYYAAMGWKGPDGVGTPVLILRGFCGKDGQSLDNACYAGQIDGWQCFCYGGKMNLHAALDVMGHEFTHGVTNTTMSSHLYQDDYGAINESMSDILGNICEMAAGATEDTTWLLGENTGSAFRSMSDPHVFSQPEYIWDLYFTPGTDQPNDVNDRGGVHSKSSILSLIAAKLCLEGGMTLREAELFWLTVACVLTPRTDFPQLAAVLPWALQASGNGKYSEKLQELIGETRMSEHRFPEKLGAGQRLVTLQLPDTEAFADPHWILFAYQIDVETIGEWAKTGADLLLSLILGKDFDGTRIDRLLADLGLQDLPENPGRSESRLLLARILERLFSQHTSWASGESREIRAVLKQQTTVYVMLNLDPEKIELRSLLLLMDGEWVDLTWILTMDPSGDNSFDAVTPEKFELLLRALGRLPDLLAKQDPAVRWIELPSKGLDQVQLKTSGK